MTKYVQVTLKRATDIDARIALQAGTTVYAKASYQNIVYTTTSVKDMGQNPVFLDDGTNVCHFAYENESDFITVELYNRNDACIGKSKLLFTELAKLLPEQEKPLPVQIDSNGYSKPFGDLHFTAQTKQGQAWGEQGNLEVTLVGGSIRGLTSIFGGKTKMKAKLTYKHTTFSSGTLEGTGNKFVWHSENKFTFIINSSKSEDVLGIKVYNRSNKVGECKIQMSLLMTGEDNARPVNRTADLLLKNKSVGSIEVAASFTKAPVGFNGSTSFVPQSARDGYPPEAHGAPAGLPVRRTHFLDHPEISKYVNTFH